MQFEQLIQAVSLGAIPILFAITLHEAAHGYVAKHFGDMTAYQMGRISLNPARHIDPLGTVLLPLLMLWMSGGSMLFGWAKPVPVNFGALRDPKKDMFWVALAGPLSNLAMGMIWALLYKLSLMMPGNYFAEPLMGMSVIGIKINSVLLVLNLLPLPPLDGGRVALSLLPHRQAYLLNRIEPYGMFVLIVLAVTPVLGWILFPLVELLENFLLMMVGV